MMARVFSASRFAVEKVTTGELIVERLAGVPLRALQAMSKQAR